MLRRSLVGRIGHGWCTFLSALLIVSFLGTPAVRAETGNDDESKSLRRLAEVMLEQTNRLSVEEGLDVLDETISILQERGNQTDEEKELITRLTARQYYLRGYGHYNRGEYMQAIIAYEAVLRIRPDDVAACNNLAWTLAVCPEDRFRDADRALKLARRACRMSEWKNPVFVDTLAAAYAENGEYAMAVYWQQQAVEHDDFPESEADGGRQRLELYTKRRAFREFHPNQQTPSKEQISQAIEALKTEELNWRGGLERESFRVRRLAENNGFSRDTVWQDSRVWWTAFEDMNADKPHLVLKLAEELKQRQATILEFFIAYCLGGQQDAKSTLNHLDTLRCASIQDLAAGVGR